VWVKIVLFCVFKRGCLVINVEDHYLHLWASALLIQRHFNGWWWGWCLCFIKPPLSPNIKTLKLAKARNTPEDTIKARRRSFVNLLMPFKLITFLLLIVRKAICQRKQMVLLFKTWGFTWRRLMIKASILHK